jgi:hypothetical protein
VGWGGAMTDEGERLMPPAELEDVQRWTAKALEDGAGGEVLLPAATARALLAHIEVLELRVYELDGDFCRVCGCTQNNACEGGCHWVEADLCSSCAGDVVGGEE